MKNWWKRGQKKLKKLRFGCDNVLWHLVDVNFLLLMVIWEICLNVSENIYEKLMKIDLKGSKVQYQHHLQTIRGSWLKSILHLLKKVQYQRTIKIIK